MADGYEVKFIGWMKEGTSDKIWGFIELNNGKPAANSWQAPEPGSLYNFWGKRGKTLSFKRHYGRWGNSELHDLQNKKIRKGYRPLSMTEIEEICPGFQEELDKQFVMAKFSGKIMSDHEDENTSFM